MVQMEFYKEVQKSVWDKPTMEKVTVVGENLDQAYDKALAMGHNPNKNIRWREI